MFSTLKMLFNKKCSLLTELRPFELKCIKSLNGICFFLKNSYHTVFIYENNMLSIFSTEIKIICFYSRNALYTQTYFLKSFKIAQTHFNDF